MIPEDLMDRARAAVGAAVTSEQDVVLTIAQALLDERNAGGAEMLERIRASLIEYPDGGIDVVVARRVEHIVGAATDKLELKIESLKGDIEVLQNRIDDMRGWRIPK